MNIINFHRPVFLSQRLPANDLPCEQLDKFQKLVSGNVYSIIEKVERADNVQIAARKAAAELWNSKNKIHIKKYLNLLIENALYENNIAKTRGISKCSIYEVEGNSNTLSPQKLINSNNLLIRALREILNEINILDKKTPSLPKKPLNIRDRRVIVLNSPASNKIWRELRSKNQSLSVTPPL